MSRNQRKAPAELPAVGNLGPRITQPRKGNRAAAKAVSAGDNFWDKRKVASKARRKVIARDAREAAHPPVHRLSSNQKHWLMRHLPSWSWDKEKDALLAPNPLLPAHLDELAACARLPYLKHARLRLSAQNMEEAALIAGNLRPSTCVVFVDTKTGMHRRVRITSTTQASQKEAPNAGNTFR